MKLKFYATLIFLLILLKANPILAQSTVQWEKAFPVSQSGASALMFTDAKLNSYFVSIKEDTSFLYKLDSSGKLVFKKPFSDPFYMTSIAQKLKNNTQQFVFIGTSLKNTSFFKFDLNGNKLAETVLPNVNEVTSIDLDAGDNTYLASSGLNSFYLTRVNADGSFAWQKHYDDPNTENEMEARLICGKSNDIFFVYDAVNAKNQSIVNPIVSFNATDGSLRWKAFVHNTSAKESTLNKPAITLDNTGNLLATAAIYDTVSSNQKTFVCKFNASTGNTMFKMEDASAFVMNFHKGMTFTTDNKIIVSGTNGVSFGTMISCYDNTGNYLWTRNFPERSALSNQTGFIYSPAKNLLYFANSDIFSPTDTIRIYSLNTNNSLHQLFEYSHVSALKPLFTNTSILVGNISEENGHLFVLGNSAEISGAFGFNPSEPFLLKCTVNSPTGIYNTGVEKSVQIFPNPATDLLMIKTNTNAEIGSKYSIYNAFGQIIYSGEIAENQTSINVSNFADGLYILEIGAVKSRFIKN